MLKDFLDLKINQTEGLKAMKNEYTTQKAWDGIG